MVAKIEPHDLEATVEELLGEGQDVERLGAAFPAVQYDSGVARSVAWAGPEALQSHAIAAVEQYLLFRGYDRSRSPGDGPSSRNGAGQHRLDVPVA